MKPARALSAHPWIVWLPWVSLVVTLGITFLAWRETVRHDRANVEQKFKFRTAEIKTGVLQRMEAYEQILQGSAGLFAASDEVSRKEFKAYVDSLDIPDHFPGTQAVGYARLVPAAERGRLTGQIRREGFPDFSLKPDGSREVYTAVVYIEPFNWRNRRAFGYDMYTNLVRHAAMDLAWRQGTAALSGKVRLVQETEQDVQPGVLMYVPVYRRGLPVATQAERRVALQGWVYAAFRMDDLMRGIVEKNYGEVSNTIDLEIFDGNSLKPEAMLYDDDALHISLSAHSEVLKTVSRIMVGGRTWTIAMYALPNFDGLQDNRRQQAVAAVGILGSGMLTLLVWLLVNGRQRAVRLAELMSGEALERERYHKTLLEHLPAAVVVHGPDGRIRYFNAEAGRVIGRSQLDVAGLAADFRQWRFLRDDGSPMPPGDYPVNRVLEDEKPVQNYVVGVVREDDDGVLWQLVSAYPYFGEDGKLREVVVSFLDVTARREAEQAVRGALAELDDLYENAPCGYHSLDGEGRIKRINRTELDWLGYTREEMLGRSFMDLFSPASLAAFKVNYPAFKALGYVRDLEYELVRKDGSTFSVLLSATAIYGEDGSFLMSRSTLYDITARKRAEQELERTRSQLQRIVDVNPAAIYRVQLDPEGGLPPHVSFLSSNIVELAGYAQDEWAAPGFWEAHIHPDDRAGVLAAQAELFERGALEHEYRFQRHDGEMIWIYDRLVLIRDPAGRPAEIVGTWLDISGRARAEQALRCLNRFHAILSHVNEAIVRVKDEDQLFREICRIAVEEGGLVMAWVGILDSGQEEVMSVAHAGREEGYLGFLAERGVFRRNGPTARAIVENRPYINNDMAGNSVMGYWREEALQRGYRSSAAYPLRRNGRPVGALTLYAGQPDGFSTEIIELFRQLADDVSFAMDFFDQDRRRREAERKLGQLNEELEQRVAHRTRQLLSANKELESFSYSVSHDLRAPLRSIEGFSQILMRKYGEQLDETGKDYLQRVLRAGQRMGELIDDLLTLARVSRAELIRERVDLSRVAREVTGDLQAGKPDRVVEFVIQEGIIVDADARLMRGVLENLLSNAWKFTARQAHPRIEFGKCEVDGKPAYFVRDNGAGFDMQYAGKLFGAFQRLHRAEDFEGTGIGLATVQRIVNRHGGAVWAEGEVDKGATIYFTLE